MVAISSIASLLSGCAISSKQRTIATYATIGVSLVGVGVYGQAVFASCPPVPGSRLDQCEEDRNDRKNLGGVIAIGGVVAAIVAQLWPVTDERPEPTVAAGPIELAPPPEPPAHATTLRDPASVKLAANARSLAAQGKCVEAFGSLNALRRIDAALADQLLAWDPYISSCRTTLSSQSATPAPSGPPAATAPTATP